MLAIDRFLDAAARSPGAAAAIDAGRTLSYAELDDRSDRLAGLLTGFGAEPERGVGIFLPRSADLIVAILGVLKAGAVCVPFDPVQPDGWLSRLASDVSLVTTVTHASLRDRAPLSAGREPVLADQLDWASLGRARPVSPHPDNLAYTIFTSGSTGQPKGVQISHRALASFLTGMEAGGFFLAPGARVGWNASMAFDASVQQWIRAFRGDTVAVLDDETRRDPAAFARFMRTHRLTEVDMTPSHAQLLLDDLAELAGGRQQRLRLFIAGEAIPEALWTRLTALTERGLIEAMNLYGPTETAVNVYGTAISPGTSPHIGGPLAGVTARVADENLRAVAAGTAGQLCVGGPFLARGYAGQPALTAERFVPDPGAAGGARMYLTGDLVVTAAESTTRYLGRADDQVKIRGHRVEPGQIANVLVRDPGVVNAAVVANGASEPGGGQPELHAFVQCSAGVDVREVRRRADAQLPEWMRPVSYLTVAAIPLTTSGKADRAALLKLLPARPGHPADPAGFVDPVKSAGVGSDSPAGDIAGLILSIWSEVLSVSEINGDDNFFEIGGHSLSAMAVVSRLRARLGGVKVPTVLIFRHRTLTAFTTAVTDFITR